MKKIDVCLSLGEVIAIDQGLLQGDAASHTDWVKVARNRR